MDRTRAIQLGVHDMVLIKGPALNLVLQHARIKRLILDLFLMTTYTVLT